MLNILVVDDSAVMRSMVIRTLKMSGVPLGSIHQASNGREGLDVLEGNWIDLLLVDLNMPVMTGEEMIDHLRARQDTADLPILVISTEGSQTRIEAIRSKGASFIHKPFTPEDLGNTIRDLTGVSGHEQHDGGFDPSSGLDF